MIQRPFGWRWLPQVGLIWLLGLGTAWGEMVSQQALLEPAAFATLSSRMAGTIAAMHVREGGSFARGDLLVAFDCSGPKASLAKGRADLQMAEKKHEVNRRMKELDSVSQVELALSEAMVQKARADVGIAQVFVQDCAIHAPYDGRVSQRHVQPFDGVAVGAPLLDILANGPLRVSMYVPWSWSTWLTVKTPFAIRLQEKGPEYAARVTAMGARVDPASQTLGIWGEMNAVFPELLAGMSVTARLDSLGSPGEGGDAR
ncbi:MAG: HlyD family efflux transporter periplasmic adaptor subunit [Magnetococcales bacterium]|nr:HlyD family efflux transporter periplasmic adaptor subunit [Magnetococcales bacterium]